MDLNKLEQDINSIVKDVNRDEFIYELLQAYDFPKSSITRLKKGDYNKSKNESEILWKKNIFFKVEEKEDLHLTIDEAQKDPAILKHNPRFIIVTDFDRLLAVDTRIGDTLDKPIKQLSESYTFFLPWAGMEKTQIQSLNLADVKAAEKLAQLYDIIIQENHIESDQERHGLNIFLSRLLFCFFAEDTGIFEDNQFTNAIASHTQEDGSDLQDYLIALFKVMNVENRTNEPQHVKDFPYVNGGLFAVDYPAPKLNAKARKMIVEAGTLNWKQINPDIFGSMLQAVVHSDQRGSLGMHYTSVANIMKVIEPLFLNDLREQLEKAGDNKTKLSNLRDRLYNLRLFDPACGSGNFLIIAYKELCKLEIEILKRLDNGQISISEEFVGRIKLTQFYGIELDDFAHETAKLSLWLAEHQMNLAFKEVFGSAKPTLPLQDGGHIVCANATRKNWEDVCPKDEGVEIYIMGNPPYVGSRKQSKDQKVDMTIVLDGINGYKNLDYIACWFFLGVKYIQDSNSKLALVSTNSIIQGQQVSLLWPYIIQTDSEIAFAHQSFKWTNNAKGNAGVTCVIIGLRNILSEPKYLFNGGTYSLVKNINAYLIARNNIFIQKERKPLMSVPIMMAGNYTGHAQQLMLTEDEKNRLVSKHPKIQTLLRKVIGSNELIKGITRWCLWISDENKELAESFPEVRERIELVKVARQESKDTEANKLVARPHQFRDIRETTSQSIVVPTVSSERRKYLPIIFIDKETIVTNKAMVLYDSEPYIFSLLASKIHMTWIRVIGGRMREDISYSSVLCYNTFPFPKINEAQKATLEDHVFKLLDEREKHPEKTMAELYDPDKMPEGLRQAHHEMDLVVEQCYRKKPFSSDEERLEYLFKLYEEMIQAEKK